MVNGQLLMVNFVQCSLFFHIPSSMYSQASLFSIHYFGCKGSNYFLITKQKAEKILFFLLLIDLYSVW